MHLEMRRAVERRTGAHERRLYSCLMYCDDGLLIIVGAARTIRILKIWRKLVIDSGLIMAIPEKRTVGVWCVWIGAIIFAGLGVVAVPRSKILRSSAAIVRLCQSGIEFGEYRSLMGLLEHVRCIARVPKRYTHGLYAPHGADVSPAASFSYRLIRRVGPLPFRSQLERNISIPYLYILLPRKQRLSKRG